MKIEGVPEGWELVSFGKVMQDEFYVSNRTGSVLQWRGVESDQMYLKVRRVETVCTWQHGVFVDGWIAEDADGSLWLYSHRPHTSIGMVWTGLGGEWAVRLKSESFLTPPVFRHDLPWTERIQQVGPTIEATLKVMT